MISVSPQLPIFVHRGFVDFRNGIDGLIGVCHRELKKDPQSGCVFVFSNRRRQGFKILVYDGQGYWVCQKRLSTGRLKWWPQGSAQDQMCVEILARELSVLIYNGDPTSSEFAQDWKSVRQNYSTTESLAF